MFQVSLNAHNGKERSCVYGSSFTGALIVASMFLAAAKQQEKDGFASAYIWLDNHRLASLYNGLTEIPRFYFGDGPNEGFTVK